jgi:hypothetical protein
MTKLDTLKSFSRYVKKVASIQRAVREGLYQLVRIEAKLQGLGDIPVEEIDVRFRNALISTEHLDKLEFVTGMIETVRGTVESVNDIASALEGTVDKEKVIDFLNDYFGLVGLEGVIQISKGGGEEESEVQEAGFGETDWLEGGEEEGLGEFEAGSEEEFPFETEGEAESTSEEGEKEETK